MATRSRTALLVLFLLSGTAGLIHEIAWTRVLRHILGGSSLALTTVLVAFLGGLAVGAWVVARRIHRVRSPVIAFGWIELLIAAWTVLLPTWVDATWPLWRALYGSAPGPGFALARFLGSLILLAPAAIAMGASLPLLAAIETHDAPRRGRWIAALYGVNALGAAIGALVAGFVLLPSLGLTTTIRIAALLNFVAGVAAFLLARSFAPTTLAAASPVRSDPQRLLLGLYALAAAALFVHEVAWARVATLLLGSTAYAFSLLLATIVAGLAVGGFCATPLVQDRTTARRALGLAQGAVAFVGLAIVGFVPALPHAITRWFAAGPGSDGAGLAVVAAVVASLFFLPAVLMGLAYPLVCRMVRGNEAPGRPAARVQAVGNLGAVAGVLIAGPLLLPSLGLRNTLIVAAAFNAAVAISIGLFEPRSRTGMRVAAIFAVAWIVAFAALPDWNPARMSLGPFVQARRQPLEVATSAEALRRVEDSHTVLFHRDGRESSVTIKETLDGERTLWINGKPDASSISDLATQRLLAHVPLLQHPNPKRALIIGLASGVTLRSAARYPLERIDTVDVSAQAREVAGWFEHVNAGVLEDPRVRLIVADGRLHLALTEDRYDVIVSEPSNPWIAGIGDLYTAEFFGHVRRRLETGGSFCLWLPAYHLDMGAFRSVVRTFVESFPEAALWHTQGSDYLLVGSAAGAQADGGAMTRGLLSTGVVDELAELGISTLPDLFANRVVHGDSLARFARGAERHTDDNALLEFRAPLRLLSNDDEASVLLGIESFRDPDPGGLAVTDAVGVDIRRFNTARGAAIRASLLLSAGETRRGLSLLREAASKNLFDPYLERTLAANQAHADQLAASGDRAAALARYDLLLDIAPERAATQQGIARLRAGAAQ